MTQTFSSKVGEPASSGTSAAVNHSVTSADGTRIAYDQVGAGRPVILVDGALCHRNFGPLGKVAAELAQDFTVFTYDRRGRGESSDTAPYSVEREVEDLQALINAAGGSAYVCGVSSGAVLALDAANRLSGITKVAAYEAPFIVDDTHSPRPADLNDRMDALVAQNKRGAAVKLFMKTVGAPAFMVTAMSLTPVWGKLKKVAHTIPYDFRILGDTGAGKPLPASRWANVRIPALVMDGGKSPEYMRNSQRALAGVLPSASHRTLEGQTHMVKEKVLAPVLIEFFNS